MFGVRTSTCLIQRNAMLIMQNTTQAQDAVYMIVNHRRKHKIPEACNCFNFFTYFLCVLQDVFQS